MQYLLCFSAISLASEAPYGVQQGSSQAQAGETSWYIIQNWQRVCPLVLYVTLEQRAGQVRTVWLGPLMRVRGAFKHKSRSSPRPSRRGDPSPPLSVEEGEDKQDPSVPLVLTGILSFALDEVDAPASPSPLDNHRLFQELLRREVEQLKISLEEVQDFQHTFLSIPQSAGSGWVALPVNEAMLGKYT